MVLVGARYYGTVEHMTLYQGKEVEKEALALQDLTLGLEDPSIVDFDLSGSSR